MKTIIKNLTKGCLNTNLAKYIKFKNQIERGTEPLLDYQTLARLDREVFNTQ